ncbi:Aldose 1-epimerase [Melia azedarach]|uniref:Aldose 1-epimerase n=1 Tax=Melia azedarach TaxID=155640 RepID=A0ACC1X736_MELAZ|nr:Aldose 1-epimerase [Melia azedarach]
MLSLSYRGPKGFSDVVWKVKKYKNEGAAPQIIFSYDSFDGEEGFPGDLDVTVSYTLSGENELSVSMKAKEKKKATPVNLALCTDNLPSGYDINCVLDGEPGKEKVAIVYDKKSGRVMELLANQPGVQFHTSASSRM